MVSSLVCKKIDWFIGTVVYPYPRIMRSKTYRGYVKPRENTERYVWRDIRVTYINTKKFVDKLLSAKHYQH
jgi:hypothetical protein